MSNEHPKCKLQVTKDQLINRAFCLKIMEGFLGIPPSTIHQGAKFKQDQYINPKDIQRLTKENNIFYFIFLKIQYIFIV